MAATPIELAAREGDSVSLTATVIDDLRSRVDGPVLRPGDGGWDEAILLWNAMVDRVPALVALPGSAGGVAEAVRFARDHDILLGIKGGGHNIAGTSMAHGGLTLDMSRMNDVAVDPAARLAHVGPGTLLHDVDLATQEHGLATVLGFISNVGVAGLTLGGGFGYLTRRFGWTVDNLEEVEIVMADGRIRVANHEENPDLFWAVRGGGGNFGVVTRFTFRLHDMPPRITGGLIAWGADRADDVLDAYRTLTAEAPRELTAAIVIRLAPPAPFVPAEWHGKPVVAVLVCHSGANAASDLEPLRALGDPVFDVVAERPYAGQQSLLDATDHKGNNQYWKTEYIAGLSPGYLDAFRDAALRQTSPLSYSVIFHIGGALNERTADDGAVGNRDARFVTGFSGVWPPDDPRSDQHVGWVRRSWEAIRPFSTGGNYVNFQVADDSPDRTAEAYGANYDRLRRVKARYDADNLFRVNRNIVPAA
jgi:FAD/FMN-containing dehydrogenase